MSGQPFWRHPERVRTILALLFFVGFAFLFAAALPPTSKATLGPQEPSGLRKNSKPEFVPGQVLVRYRTEAIAKEQTSLAREIREIGQTGQTGLTMLTAEGRAIAVRLERFEGSDIVPGLRIAHVAAADTLAAIEALRRQPDVVYAEPNYLLYADVTNPNDPRFVSNELYGLLKIGAPQAWDVIKGSTDTPQAGFGNPRIVVGVIDEGIDLGHQDLLANIWINPADNTVNGMDDDGNGFVDDVNGYNFFANSGTIPADFHGTHVGGTVGAVGNNGIGVVGVNWNVSLMSLKFIDGGTGSTADAIRACNYAKQMRDSWVSSGGTQGANLRVLNNSYGGGGFSQSFLDAINGLNQSAILFVASAGNVGAGSTEANNEIVPHYPSSYIAPNVIGVAATDSSDSLPSYSHFGLTTVHLGAPGSGILSTTPGNNYALLSGTSMATPHVAGAAALLLAQSPNLTVQQLKSLLIFNGDAAAALLNKTVTGRRLNVFNSFQALAESDTTPPGTVTNLHVNTQTGRSINLGWTASGDDGAAGQASLYELTFTDATTSAVIPLTNILPATTSVVQAVDIKLPYRHTAGTVTLREFDNVGNEGTPAAIAVSVSLGLGDPYLTSVGSAAALSTGGTALGLIGDDKLRLNYSLLPFTFPFFGENFTAVNISTNGNLFFSAPPTRANGDADDVPSSVVDLAKYKMISGLWDDLRTDRTFGDDVYVISDASHIIFRWQGVTFGDGTPATEFPVNFEIELRTDGTIFTRYGAGQSAPTNTNLFPVVGISGGEPEAYSIPSHTSEQVAINLTNAQQVIFTPRGISTLTVASSASSSANITVTPADNGGLGNGTTPFARTYDNGTVVNLTAPATASGNNFLKWQRDDGVEVTTPATSVTMDVNHTMTAVYVTPRTLTVASSFPDSGVSITVTPNDNGGFSSGTTQFTRTYNEGTVVNLTAPASVAGNPFQKWQRDGVDWATTPATSVTMDAPHTMTAVYINIVQFTVPQFNAFEPSSFPCTGSPACDGSVTVTVSRSGDSTAPAASVEYTTSDDVATQKGDFIFSAGRLKFAAGELSKSFTVFIVDDVYQEGTEAFKVMLSNPVGTTLGVRSVANVLIFDNDGSSAPNPLDNADARFFVRQHYLDFLNREPDSGGLDFWRNQITSCGTDQACIQIRRINVSAAFFLSIEFQETGYLVERLFKTSYGDATGTSTFGGTHQLSVPIVRFTEFMADSQEISRGVVIGQPGASELLENNKQAFIASFVQRSRFTTALPTSMPAADFVDALNTNAGNPLTQPEEDALATELSSGAKTRAEVVRAVAEDSDLGNAEKNKAFVLLQYFGYLRRDPNVGSGPNPDTDYTGYDFWLSKLLQFNGNFVSAQMVEAFIVSGEYRHRFAP